jgi:hypothetical protein
MPRSYRDEQNRWGITTALQTLLMLGKSTYTVTDLMDVARMFDVTDDLFNRMDYVPDDLEYEGL